jgi:hypothetical protein
VSSRRSGWLVLLFALTGFAVAEPIFELFRQTPEFLAARQNTVLDLWALALSLSFILPVILVLPAWIMSVWNRRYSKGYVLVVAAVLCACFFAQLIQPFEDISTGAFLALSFGASVPVSYLLLFTRWRLLGVVLAVMALAFPLRFLFFSPVLDDVSGLPESSVNPGKPEASPDIVFVVFDELPLATLLGSDLKVDGRLFPGFERLQNRSNWYFDTTTVSDSTVDAVPAMLTGRYPQERLARPTIIEQPANLFTLLRNHYSYNVAESVTRLCPVGQCGLSGPGGLSRLNALLLDTLAVYLHRVTPAAWKSGLPSVETNWSGFFAERQIFFPEGWKEHMGGLIKMDRPAFFERFISSIEPADGKPTLNFIHILIPHEPLAYFPNGENYGLQWMRGRVEERWEHHEWGIVSGKQRHFLQAQLADRLVDELLDHLDSKGMLDSSLVLVTSDHGTSFIPGEQKRLLSDNNAASMLRVPLFIKPPGQVKGHRVTSPVMTIDILPTILSQLGVEVAGLGLDGIDLGMRPLPDKRPRFANSSVQRKLSLISEDKLPVAGIIAENRDHLKLESEKTAMWGIGPFGHYRGQDLSAVCAPEEASLRYRFSKTKLLSNTEPEMMLPAYIAGRVSGRDAPDESTPFVISSKGVIAASGLTWKRKDKWQFFALVEPGLVKQADWSPEVALVVDGRCLKGKRKTKPGN